MKYLVNNTAMSYKFITGLVLKKQSAMAIDDEKLEGLKGDFQFKSLTEHKLVLVTENKPKSLISAAEEIAEKDTATDTAFYMDEPGPGNYVSRYDEKNNVFYIKCNNFIHLWKL